MSNRSILEDLGFNLLRVIETGLTPDWNESIKQERKNCYSSKELAKFAIRAARHYQSWGTWATYRYLFKRGVYFELYCLAKRLEVELNG